jgi:hypothetical protein
MKAVAFVAGQPPFPSLEGLVRAKSFGFRCIKGCALQYWLFVPRELLFGLAESVQSIGRNILRKQHPDHPHTIEIPLT